MTAIVSAGTRRRGPRCVRADTGCFEEDQGARDQGVRVLDPSFKGSGSLNGFAVRIPSMERDRDPVRNPAAAGPDDLAPSQPTSINDSDPLYVRSTTLTP